MADTNEQEIIRCFEEIAKYDLPAETVEQHLRQVRERLTDQASVPPERKSIRRIFFSNRWMKLAAAAGIVLALAATFHLFSNPRLEAAELLTLVARNMEKLAWVKTVTEKYGADQNVPVGVDVHWTDVTNKRVYAVYDKKYVHLMDYRRGEWSVYRPDTNDMVVKPLSGDWSPAGEVQEYIAKLKREGITVHQSETMFQGKKAILVEFDETLNDIGSNAAMTNMMMDGKSVKTIRQKLLIDPNRIIGAAEISYLERNGQLISVQKSRMEPLTRGPSDIYELGVPRHVKIINNVPDPAVQALRQKINDYRARFLNEYIAVITEAEVQDETEEIREATVVFCQGRKIRADVYYRDPRPRERLAWQYRTELEASLRYVRPFWPEEDGRDIRSVRLYDGLWQYVTEVKDDGFVAWEKQRRPDGDMYSDDDMDDFGWRTLWWLNEPEHLYEDSYSKEHGLVGMELTSQCGVGTSVPKRLVLYVDPQKDYTCARYIDEQLFDAPWQSDKTWLDKVENKPNLREELRDFEVREYGRTSSGQWYPKVIAETSYYQDFGTARQDTSRLIRIHLVAEHPQFPAGIFDPKELPQVKP
jgi:hypothetical protein